MWKKSTDYKGCDKIVLSDTLAIIMLRTEKITDESWVKSDIHGNCQQGKTKTASCEFIATYFFYWWILLAMLLGVLQGLWCDERCAAVDDNKNSLSRSSCLFMSAERLNIYFPRISARLFIIIVINGFSARCIWIISCTLARFIR